MDGGDRIAGQLAQAQLALLRGNADTTLALCRAVLDIDPHHAGACFLLGRAQEAAGHGEEALHWIGRAVDLEPERDEWRRHLDQLVRSESKRPVARIDSPKEIARVETQPAEPARWRHDPRILAALAAGAVCSLLAGLWTGQKLYVPKDRLPKPLLSKPSKTEPVVVASPPAAGTAPAAPPPVRPANPANPAPREPAAPAAEGAPIELTVPGADSAKFDPASGMLRIRFLIPGGEPPARDTVATTAEGLARAALALRPDARGIVVEAATPSADGGFGLVWRGEGTSPWPADQTDSLLRPSVP